MAIGDIPKFPLEYASRGKKLIQKLEKNDLSMDEVKNTIASVLGRVTIDTKGIRVAGDFGSFGINAEGFEAINESLRLLLDFLPVFEGRELFFKTGEKITKITVAFPPKQVPATLNEFQESEFPMIEFPSESKDKNSSNANMKMLAAYFQGADANLGGGGFGNNIRIHRIEELAGWLGDGWEGVVKLMDIGLPLLTLTTKETLDKLGESYPSFWDDVFKRCGV